jgi:hypothetical protein
MRALSPIQPETKSPERPRPSSAPSKPSRNNLLVSPYKGENKILHSPSKTTRRGLFDDDRISPRSTESPSPDFSAQTQLKQQFDQIMKAAFENAKVQMEVCISFFWFLSLVFFFFPSH